MLLNYKVTDNQPLFAEALTFNLTCVDEKCWCDAYMFGYKNFKPVLGEVSHSENVTNKTRIWNSSASVT